MAQGGQGSPPHPDMLLWRLCVRHWFPRLHKRAYFVPPVYMNRVPYQTVQFAGLNVDMTQTPLEKPPANSPPALHKSTAREDQTQQRILHCVQKLAETQDEPMVVVSQLLFGDYLNKPCYAAAASMLPRPIDLKKENKHRGDFDLLIMHKHYGLVVAEIKAVGDNFSCSGLTEQQQDDSVAKRVLTALKQLDKAEKVLTHLVSDMQNPPRVRKTLMLPNITRCRLQRVLDAHHQVRQELCQCLDLQAPADPVDLCLCHDDLSDSTTPWDVSSDVIERLSVWWTRRVAGPLISMADADYEDLVARFCGPATTVEVFCVTKPPLHFLRGEGEGVAETSRRFTRVVLHPEQLDVLNMHLPLVWLCGPPGTGKTLVLVVRAHDWWQQGWHVHVLSTWKNSMAASHLIAHQVQQSTGDSAGQRVHLHLFDFEEQGQMKAAVNCLVAAASQGPLCLVADEVHRDFIEVCTELHKRVHDLRVWAASLFHGDKPPSLTEVPMTEPLRTPPVVTRHVQESPIIHISKRVRAYTPGSAPLPADGPSLRVLYHAGPGHSGGKPEDCELCGAEVARVLQELRVSLTGHITSHNTAAGAIRTIPAPLTYRDVFLLTAWDDDTIVEEERDAAGNVVRRASGVVRGLRQAGVPVKVLARGDTAGFSRDVALMAGLDQVLAANARTVSGMERKVVVWLQRGPLRAGDIGMGRLHAMSRATAQLIWVTLTQ